MDVSLRLMNSNSQDSQAKPDAGFNVTTSLTSHYISAPRRFSGPRCEELKTSLEERLVLLTGGRDRRGGPVLSFPQTSRREKAGTEEYHKMLDYLTTLPW